MTTEILKQAFKEAYNELQQEEKDKTTVLTAREAADILRINYRTLLNRIHSGKYKFTADGYQYIITLYQLKKYL
jgi:excisionase family DNA binding protein|tara:strand:+ start:574 stop:795 length:222 start_codon:yes stop_codon:yes gene_type:complete